MSKKDPSIVIDGNHVGFLLLHGLGGTPMELRYVANGVARSGYTVHCPLLAGHAGTEKELATVTWQDWYDGVEAELHRMRKRCDIVVVGGLSAGAIIALLLAARNPKQVQATVSYAPTLWLNGWTMPWYAGLFRLVRHKWCANMFAFPDEEPHGIKDPRVRDLIHQALHSGDKAAAGVLHTPGGPLLEHRWMVDTFKREVGKITQPALVIHPREDDHADLNNAEFLQRNMAGRVSMVVLDDSYHIITLDQQRQVVVERTTAFINEVVQEIEAVEEPDAAFDRGLAAVFNMDRKRARARA